MECKCGKNMIKNGKRKGRQCWRCMECGKAKTEEYFFRHLEEEERELCLKMVNGGATFQAVADAFGVTRQTIGNIVKKKK
ncbi:MAG: hypothetical protein QG630_549 [Patescibacteria group bacterium]|nr:hypothetical protein [Patescibacteria group bacterium]